MGANCIGNRDGHLIHPQCILKESSAYPPVFEVCRSILYSTTRDCQISSHLYISRYIGPKTSLQTWLCLLLFRLAAGDYQYCCQEQRGQNSISHQIHFSKIFSTYKCKYFLINLLI